jgi:hypothetical protein
VTDEQSNDEHEEEKDDRGNVFIQNEYGPEDGGENEEDEEGVYYT